MRARAIDAFTRQLDMGEHGNTNSLAELHETRRELARAVELTQLRLRVDPTNALSYGNMAGYFVEQGNLAAADSILAVAAQRGIHSPHIAMHRARVMVARDSLWRAHEITDSLRGAVRGTYNLRAKQALAFQYVLQGQIAQGERMRAEHLADDRARGNPAMPVRDTVRAVYRDAWLFGPAPSLMQRLNAAVAAAPLAERNESALDLARTYAFLGAPARARSLLSAWEGERRDSVMRRLSVPQVQLAQAEIALAERRYADAVALFRKADTVSDGPVSACASCLPANLGRTFDLAGQRDSAILAFEKAVVHARLSPLEAGGALLLPAIEQRLGELYEAAGDRQKAYAHYERFTMYWKDADPVLRPRVADVRRRMARLGDIERK